MSTTDILLAAIAGLMALNVWLSVKLISATDDLHLEQSAHRITLQYLEKERSKQP